ncbi:hypothetical protein [Nannocystis punicea]|uniref:Uncharacterized protein n=1 Tax=Nannocystis punicea TaxID=2995304 RepID=A0ABY7GUU2_9BACT|nr:hypothetical protein [Nannocystis poenicansa]WAS90734.1 hypothetical protein O0S08_31490 [Nannocystis poenicansa]
MFFNTCSQGQAAVMSLDHEFLLLDRDTPLDFESGLPFIHDPRALHIHDSVIGYMFDTLQFIPTVNPERGDEQHGLLYYGSTVIRGPGAAIAAKVFHAWADLFAAGPPRPRLTGPYLLSHGETDDDDPGEPANDEEYLTAPAEPNTHDLRHDHGGDPIRFEFDRDALVAALRRLADWCALVAADDRHIVLHHGI